MWNRASQSAVLGGLARVCAAMCPVMAGTGRTVCWATAVAPAAVDSAATAATAAVSASGDLGEIMRTSFGGASLSHKGIQLPPRTLGQMVHTERMDSKDK